MVRLSPIMLIQHVFILVVISSDYNWFDLFQVCRGCLTIKVTPSPLLHRWSTLPLGLLPSCTFPTPSPPWSFPWPAGSIWSTSSTTWRISSRSWRRNLRCTSTTTAVRRTTATAAATAAAAELESRGSTRTSRGGSERSPRSRRDFRNKSKLNFLPPCSLPNLGRKLFQHCAKMGSWPKRSTHRFFWGHAASQLQH